MKTQERDHHFLWRLICSNDKQENKTPLLLLWQQFICCVMLATSLSCFCSRHRFVIIVATQLGTQHAIVLASRRHDDQKKSASQLVATVNSITVEQAAHQLSFILRQVVTDGFWTEPVQSGLGTKH